MASAEYTHSVTVRTTQDTVWTSLQSADTWADIGPVDRVWDPVVDNDVLMGYRWATDIGGRTYEGTARTVDHTRPSRFSMVLDAGEMAGTIGIDLAPNEIGTHLEVSLLIESRGMLSSLFFPAIKNAIGSGFPDQVEGMAQHLED